MPAPLSVPRVPPGFLPLAATGSQTVLPGGQTALGTEAGGQTVLSGSYTASGTEAGRQTTRPIVAMSSTVSQTSAAPHTAPVTPSVPPMALASLH
jgi:hypothetical protein